MTAFFAFEILRFLAKSTMESLYNQLLLQFLRYQSESVQICFTLNEALLYRLKYCLKGPLNPRQPTNQDVPQVAQRNVSIVAHTRHRSPSGWLLFINEYTRYSADVLIGNDLKIIFQRR